MIQHRPICMISLLWVLLGWIPANGQIPKLPNIERFGIDGFRLMLQQHELRATQNEIGSAFEMPKETVAILLGDLTTVSRIGAQLNRFVDAGGALLVASDVQDSKVPGAWIRPTKMLPNSEKRRHGFRGFNDCPIVRNFDRNSTSLFDAVESIVANRPGQLDCVDTVQQVAWLPSRRNPPFMATYQKESGRMLLVADHSLFINEMLVHADNAKFANNVCSWLCEGGNRTRLVLVSDGQVLPDWSFGETPPAIPLEKLLRAIQHGGLGSLPIGESVLPIVNESLASFQRQDGFNRTASRLFTGVFGRRPIRVVMIMVTVGLGLGFLGWLFGTRSRPLRWLSFQDWNQRSESKLVGAVRDAHYFPYVRTLAREFFLENGADGFDQATGPNVQANSITGEGKVVRDVKRLWNVAADGTRLRMSKRSFTRELTVLRQLRQLQLAGELSLEWASATPTGTSKGTN